MKKMNRLKYYLALFLMTTLVNSCDFLDVVPDGVATIDMAFRDRATAERYLYTCYSYMPNHFDQNANPGMSSSDEFVTWKSDQSWYNRTLVETGNNTNSPYDNYWDGSNGGKAIFAGIRCCNILLENVNLIPDISETEKARWVAEAKFLKAYYHWWLFQIYGPIPIVDKNLDVTASSSELRVYREPVDNVINYIVQTLDEAIPGLPTTTEIKGSELTDMGRISKEAAFAIKARVLVTAASPLFNGGGEESGYKPSLVDNKGRQLFNQQFDPTKWERAAIACKQAIDTCKAAGFELYKFKPVRAMVINDSVSKVIQTAMILGDKWNSELIWGHSNNSSTGLQSNTCPFNFYFGAWQDVLPGQKHPTSMYYGNSSSVFGSIAPSINSAEIFYSKNGVPVEYDTDPSVQSSYNNRFTLGTVDAAHKYYIREGAQTALFHFNREPRYYGSIGFEAANWYGWGKTSHNDMFYIKCKNNDNGNRRGESGMYLRKYTPYTTSTTGLTGSAPATVSVVFTPYPFPVVRLADLYLMYAEAKNETMATASPEVYQYIDSVRLRAGLKGVVESYSTYTTQGYQTKKEVRKIIHRERRIELAYEGIAYYDKRRWEELLDNNDGVRVWTVNTDDKFDFVKPKVIWTNERQIRDYFWPISINTLIKNPNLAQNPFWK